MRGKLYDHASDDVVGLAQVPTFNEARALCAGNCAQDPFPGSPADQIRPFNEARALCAGNCCPTKVLGGASWPATAFNEARALCAGNFPIGPDNWCSKVTRLPSMRPALYARETSHDLAGLQSLSSVCPPSMRPALYARETEVN